MSGDAVSRRLAAIVVADFSRLIGADEEGRLAHLKSLRRDLIDPKLVHDKGRTVRSTGDGMLIEFANTAEGAPTAAG